MTTPIKYYNETWQQWFYFMEGWTEVDAIVYLKKINYNVDDMRFYCGKTIYNENGTGPIIIWTKPVMGFGKRAAILAHECIHAAHITLNRCGVKADFNNDEVVTYLVTDLIRKAVK